MRVREFEDTMPLVDLVPWVGAVLYLSTSVPVMLYDLTHPIWEHCQVTIDLFILTFGSAGAVFLVVSWITQVPEFIALTQFTFHSYMLYWSVSEILPQLDHLNHDDPGQASFCPVFQSHLALAISISLTLFVLLFGFVLGHFVISDLHTRYSAKKAEKTRSRELQSQSGENIV